MRDILFKAKRIDNGEWVEGSYLNCKGATTCKHYIRTFDDEWGVEWVEVDETTICQYTGLNDNHGNKIWENDVVEFLGYKGKIVFECGCFGIGSKITIDWDKISDNIFPITGCNNFLKACENDNFISLWEIYWNFNEEENCIYMIDTIGNIFDSPELLEGGGEDEIDRC